MQFIGRGLLTAPYLFLYCHGIAASCIDGRRCFHLDCAGMGNSLELKPTHKAVVAYYEALAKFEKLGVKHEGAVSSAFEDLLEHCAKLTGRVLIPKYSLKRKGAKPIIPDAAVVDSLSQVLRYGLWEAKDIRSSASRTKRSNSIGASKR
jgi:hypothetical protein